MTKQKWTPGPWVANGDYDCRWVSGPPMGYNLEYINHADANLIAAAPELYDALSYARRFMKADQYDLEFIDAALAKARGEA